MDSRGSAEHARAPAAHSSRRCTATASNGPALVLLAGVLFSFGPLLYRSTSLFKAAVVAAEAAADATGSQAAGSAGALGSDAAAAARAGVWRYLVWRFIGVCGAAALWLGISQICSSLQQPGAYERKHCVSRQRLWRSALGGAMMAGCNICFIGASDSLCTCTTKNRQ